MKTSRPAPSARRRCRRTWPGRKRTLTARSAGETVRPNGRTRRCRHGLAVEGFAEMPPTGGDVTLVAADFHLRAFGCGPTLLVEPEIHRGLASAETDRLELDQIVGDAEQRRAPGEELALKVRAQAVAKDGNVEDVGDLRQLPDLLGRQKLHFIEQHAGDRLAGVFQAHAREDVVGADERDCAGAQADARFDAAGPVTRVDRGREEQRAHPALPIIMAGLQQHRALAGVHRCIIEVDLGHGRRGP